MSRGTTILLFIVVQSTLLVADIYKYYNTNFQTYDSHMIQEWSTTRLESATIKFSRMMYCQTNTYIYTGMYVSQAIYRSLVMSLLQI